MYLIYFLNYFILFSVSDEMSQFVPSRNAKIAFGALAVAAITLGNFQTE